jgi:trimeric autotransporter adhesin
MGVCALRANTTGNSNVSLGTFSGQGNTEGIGNSFLGMYAGATNTTGDYNTAIGIDAGTASSPFTLNTADNRVVIGNNNITNAYVKVAWTVTSDARDKMNISNVPHGLDFVSKLEPVSFQFKKDRDTEIPHGNVRYGFKAQDILALEGEDNVIIDNENPDNLKYQGEALVPVLVNAIKELKSQNEDLKSRIEMLENS